jgi:iron complex outermembrane recepter protein
MHRPTIRKTPLARGIALALGVAALTPAVTHGQEEQALELEEIVVVGIRASLNDAMEIKRNATGVVDAITAEDMGKFPDQNLAEALQRITGVSIDRFNAEGSRITVRGMGPEFNLVTLNGRSMPTAGGRSFDFNDIASEGVSAVEVYKTARADLPTGGIGATVNIATARPLDNPGFRSLISAKAVHETSASDASVANLDEFTPEVAGIFSNTFADDTFGILVTASYQRRDNREENAAVDKWIPSYELTPDANNPLTAGAVENNNQREDGVFWHPQNAGYGWSDISRTRINGQAVLQWAPNDRLKATLDYTYSEFEFEKDANSVGIWFQSPNASATINDRGTVTQVTQMGGDYATNISRDHTIKENDSIGFNLDWQATDNLSLSLDAHTSSSQLRGGGIGGEPMSSANLIIGNTFCDWCGFVPGAGQFTASIDEKTATYGAGGIPIFNATFRSTGPDGAPQDFLLPQDIGSLFGQAFNTDVQNDIDQIQLGGKWQNADGGAVSRIDFGYAYTRQKFDARNAESGQLPAGFWLTSAQYWPDGQWQAGNFRGLLSGFSNAGNFPLSQYYTLGFKDVVEGFETVGADNFPCCYWPDTNFWGPDFQDPSGNRGRFWSGPLGNSGASVVEETINSLYTQVVVQSEFNGMPFNAILGLRYEDTSIRSKGLERAQPTIVWVGGNEFAYQFADGNAFREGDGDNEFWLPSLDVDLDVVDNVKARFSYSRSIARPPVGALTPNRSFPGNPTVNSRVASSGNPDLLPYVSDNVDLSVEWYYAPGSYVSAGYFRKKVDNFLVTTFVETTFPDILDPYIGADAEQARADLRAEGIANPNDQQVFARINQNLGNPVGSLVFARPGDPVAAFTVSTTDNAQVGNLYGWELAVQHMFGDSGFGVQANATIVRGDVNANRNIIDQSFALPGLSDSANLTVFYENDRISTRLAYNWRDEFLGGFDQYGSPVFNEEYQQLDFNATWYARDKLAVFFEAINITEEVQRVYVRYPEQFLRGNQYGARYNIGARYNF